MDARSTLLADLVTGGEGGLLRIGGGGGGAGGPHVPVLGGAGAGAGAVGGAGASVLVGGGSTADALVKITLPPVFVFAAGAGVKCCISCGSSSSRFAGGKLVATLREPHRDGGGGRADAAMSGFASELVKLAAMRLALAARLGCMGVTVGLGASLL